MGKLLLITIVFLADVSLLQAQTVNEKKCKTCGKPLKECQYKGKHPRQQPTNTPAPLKRSFCHFNKCLLIIELLIVGYFVPKFF